MFRLTKDDMFSSTFKKMFPTPLHITESNLKCNNHDNVIEHKSIIIIIIIIRISSYILVPVLSKDLLFHNNVLFLLFRDRSVVNEFRRSQNVNRLIRPTYDPSQNQLTSVFKTT